MEKRKKNLKRLITTYYLQVSISYLLKHLLVGIERKYTRPLGLWKESNDILGLSGRNTTLKFYFYWRKQTNLYVFCDNVMIRKLYILFRLSVCFSAYNETSLVCYSRKAALRLWELVSSAVYFFSCWLWSDSYEKAKTQHNSILKQIYQNMYLSSVVPSGYWVKQSFIENNYHLV